MAAVDYLKQSIDFLHESFRQASEGLTPEQLHFSPEGESHSIAWIIWHAARIEDVFVQRIFQSRPELWGEGGWAAKTGLPELGMGTGQPTEEAKAVKINDLEAFRSYAQEVVLCTDAFVSSLSDEDL